MERMKRGYGPCELTTICVIGWRRSQSVHRTSTANQAAGVIAWRSRLRTIKAIQLVSLRRLSPIMLPSCDVLVLHGGLQITCHGVSGERLTKRGCCVQCGGGMAPLTMIVMALVILPCH